MKVCYLTSYYPPFLTDFFKKNNCSEYSYTETLNQLLQCFFADTGSLYHHTKEAGHEAFIIISNCEILQKKWANENAVAFDEKNWLFEISYAQIKLFKPDIFYLEYVPEFFGDFVSSVSGFCKKIVSWISSPLNPGEKFNNIDMIFSSTPDFVGTFRKHGLKSEYMHPAFDKRILQKIDQSNNKSIPFSFVGGWSDVHLNRKKALKVLAKKTPIQLWGYNYKRSLSKRKLIYYKNLISRNNRTILSVYRGEAWGLEMYSIIQRSLITFNIHESLLKGHVGNMRMFEATGMGTLLLNDEGINLTNLFEPGKEIVTYSNINEAIEKVNYYLSHPDEAIKIGKNAQQRTLKDYNYEKYVATLFSHLKKLF